MPASIALPQVRHCVCLALGAAEVVAPMRLRRVSNDGGALMRMFRSLSLTASMAMGGGLLDALWLLQL